MSKATSRNRKGPKSTRAGCMMCKPHKHQGNNGSPESMRFSDRREAAGMADDLDRLMDEVAAEMGDWYESEPPAPAPVVDFTARKAAKLDKATRPGTGMIGADTTKEGHEHGDA